MYAGRSRRREAIAGAGVRVWWCVLRASGIRLEVGWIAGYPVGSFYANCTTSHQADFL